MTPSPSVTSICRILYIQEEVLSWKSQQYKEVSRVPSLVELMLHRSRTTPIVTPQEYSSTQYCRRTRIEDEIKSLPLGKTLHEIYLSIITTSEIQLFENGLPEIDAIKVKSRVSHFSHSYHRSCNLLSQWDREILKHCSIPYGCWYWGRRLQCPVWKF